MYYQLNWQNGPEETQRTGCKADMGLWLFWVAWGFRAQPALALHR